MIERFHLSSIVYSSGDALRVPVIQNNSSPDVYKLTGGTGLGEVDNVHCGRKSEFLVLSIDCVGIVNNFVMFLHVKT